MKSWDYQMNKYEEARKLRNELCKMENEEFIDKILTADRKSLNGIVRRYDFPAYDIAEKAKLNNWILTENQRGAITNVYVYYVYGVV